MFRTPPTGKTHHSTKLYTPLEEIAIATFELVSQVSTKRYACFFGKGWTHADLSSEALQDSDIIRAVDKGRTNIISNKDDDILAENKQLKVNLHHMACDQIDRLQQELADLRASIMREREAGTGVACS